MIRVPILALALALAPLSFAQSGANSDRVVAVKADKPDLRDQLINQIQGVPATTPARPERFGEYVLSTIGPIPLIGEAAGAAVNQWMDTPKEWGQGWNSFGKRYGSNLAYNAIRQTITYTGSLALREDTRYFASGRSGFWPRTRHAAVSTFTARHTNGRGSFSFSGTAGVIGASAISSTWGPPSWKGPGNIAANAAISFASTAAFNIVREFLPDILRRPRR